MFLNKLTGFLWFAKYLLAKIGGEQINIQNINLPVVFLRGTERGQKIPTRTITLVLMHMITGNFRKMLIQDVYAK